MHRCCSRRSFFTIALFGLALATGYAGPKDIIRHEYSAEPKDENIEELLYLTIGVELANAGFSSTKTSDEAPYTLLVTYILRESEADVDLSLSKRDSTDTPLSRVSFTLTLDFTIDARIAEQVALLLERSGLLVAASDAETQASAIQGLFESSLGAGMTPDEILAASAIRTDVTVGAGGMVFLGKLTDYLHYGATVTASFAARKPWEKASLSIGIRIAGSRAFNDEGINGGPLYLSTAGLDVQIGTGYSRVFRIAGVLSGGAAVVSVAGDGTPLHKTIPFAETGALIRLPVGKSLFVGLDVRYSLAFDRDVLVMGLSPSISINKEL